MMLKYHIILINLIVLILFTNSCNQKASQNLKFQTIRTYSSPSAYHGKPVSRIYNNPYNFQDHYFDNDNSYIPPRNYGINRDNYYTKRRNRRY